MKTVFLFVYAFDAMSVSPPSLLIYVWELYFTF